MFVQALLPSLGISLELQQENTSFPASLFHTFLLVLVWSSGFEPEKAMMSSASQEGQWGPLLPLFAPIPDPGDTTGVPQCLFPQTTHQAARQLLALPTCWTRGSSAAFPCSTAH